MLLFSSSPPLSRSGDHPANPSTIRWWLVVGLAGFLLLLALPSLREGWRVNQASLLLNRHQATQDPAPLLEAAGILDPAPSAAGSVPFWRTFGAVAAHTPSEAAYQALEQAGEEGRLDRIGELWLGEIASHTGHWERAEEAYSRIDATNLLMERGDQALEEGDTATASHWYRAAATSVVAAMQRELDSAGEPRLPGAQAAPSEAVIATQVNRAIPLLRIGRGLLTLEQAAEAVPILELAYSEMLHDPPGTREQQAIRFSLARALIEQARATGAEPPASGAEPSANDLPPDVRARVDELVAGSLAVEETGAAHQHAGELYVLAGDSTEAAAHFYRALDLDPRLPNAYLALGEIRRHGGVPTLAREIFADGHEALPADPALATAWAIESYRTMPPELALPRLLEAAETETRDPYLFAFLGDTYLALGRPDDALEAYSQGLARAPDAAPLQARLAKLVAEIEGWPLP